MKSTRLFLDIHAIQTLPPSNINRDDTGSPKTAQYGGVKRARVSSQAWKKAMRDYFNENGAAGVGVRTKEIVQYVAEKIMRLDANISEEEAMKLAAEVISTAGIKLKDNQAKALFFLGDMQAQKLAEAALRGEKDKKEIKKILKDKPDIDIALFGRMVADDPSLNEDASSQVAHAISTHAVQTEFDFFTAVDDLAPEDNAGAGMLGTVEYNSSTLYRYANINCHEFLNQLEEQEDFINATKLFVEAFIKSMPTGKANTFANQTLPQLILITLRKDRPVNLVTAFEKPVKAKDGYIDTSIEKLFEELERSEKFVEKPLSTMYLSTYETNERENAKAENNLAELLEDLGYALKESLDC